MIAYWAEHRKGVKNSVTANPYVYALSMAIYCTAWTFYGSIGRAAEHGIDFLAIYLGPTIIMPIWWVLIRKIIRICKTQRITTLADFIAARYGKRTSLGTIVTLFSVMAIVPYIAIQLKAISDSFHICTQTVEGTDILDDSAFYVTIILAVFTVGFGTAKVETTERNEGLIMAIAFESVFKLLAFILAGLFICYGVFNGMTDIFAKANAVPELQKLFTFQEGKYTDWMSLLLLSMSAILFLPRQFQVSVAENVNEKHLRTAVWLFPLYLLLINIFVFPIALAGKLSLGNTVNSDSYILNIPLHFGYSWVTIITYLGGFASATSMTIVASMALSLMLNNYFVMPRLTRNTIFKQFNPQNLPLFSQWSRRIWIIFVLILAFIYTKIIASNYSLVSIGLVSFAGVAQFAPSVLGGLYWKRATYQAAFWSLIIGFSIWFFTLVIPTFAQTGLVARAIMDNGLFGIAWLRPTALFGMEEFSPITHGAFWSLLLNGISYFVISVNTKQTIIERNQAEIFVNILNYSEAIENVIVWKGDIRSGDLKTLITNFLGEERAELEFQNFYKNNNLDEKSSPNDTRLITFAENLLTGIIGTASALILVQSVVQAEEVHFSEVVDILRESQQIMELNYQLQERTTALNTTTNDLNAALLQLREQDTLRDEFLYTITHELRTPLTSIRALSEIIHDNTDLPDSQRQHFLHTIIKESERMSRLITQVLDLEKLESGQNELYKTSCLLADLIGEVVQSLQPVLDERQIKLTLHVQQHAPAFILDKDKIMQVLINLMSNAIKFCDKHKGEILIESYFSEGKMKFSISDNGKGIPIEQLPLIFDKFYQIKSAKTTRREGSGLGLAISKKIIELHNGRIIANNNANGGATIYIEL